MAEEGQTESVLSFQETQARQSSLGGSRKSLAEALIDGAEGPPPESLPEGEGAQAEEVPAVPVPRSTQFLGLLAAAVAKRRLEDVKGPELMEYLKNGGVKMRLVRAVVGLYEEPMKPDYPLPYLLTVMGVGLSEVAQVIVLQGEVKELRKKVLQLQSDNEQLQLEIEKEEAKENQIDPEDLLSTFVSPYNSEEELETGTC